jgi:hypothetical protein
MAARGAGARGPSVVLSGPRHLQQQVETVGNGERAQTVGADSARECRKRPIAGKRPLRSGEAWRAATRRGSGPAVPRGSRCHPSGPSGPAGDCWRAAARLAATAALLTARATWPRLRTPGRRHRRPVLRPAEAGHGARDRARAPPRAAGEDRVRVAPYVLCGPARAPLTYGRVGGTPGRPSTRGRGEAPARRSGR